MPIRRYLHINPDIVLLQYIDRIYVKKITITTVLAWNLFKSYFWRYLHINPDIMLQKYIVRSYLRKLVSCIEQSGDLPNTVKQLAPKIK